MKIVIGVLAVIILAFIVGGTWWLVSGKEMTKQTSDTSEEHQHAESDHEHTSDDTEVSITITYSDNGFSTSGDTTKAGSTILVVNKSSETLQFSSDPHPDHTDNDELNLPTLEPGEQETMIVKETGRWGFHNHENDDHSGSITITD